MVTGLAVDADGAVGSYTPGDHGYSYIADGVDLLEQGQALNCKGISRSIVCREHWLQAEAQGFASGTPEFCVFAIDVEPVHPGDKVSSCGKGRLIVGNAKGRPKLGPTIRTATGGTSASYVSITTLRREIGGRISSIDALSVPGIVAPRGNSSLIGSVAWLKYGQRETYAVVMDSGNAFGEATPATIELLLHGRLEAAQPVGPIPRESRCESSELTIVEPFESSPDLSKDRCQQHRPVLGDTDIRAKGGIQNGVITIILPVRVPLHGGAVSEQQPLSADAFGKLARANGVTSAMLNKLAHCFTQ